MTARRTQTPRPRRLHPNPRVVRIADALERSLAMQVSAAKAHIARELSVTDGYPSGTDGMRRGGSASSSTERAFARRKILNDTDWQIDENLRTIEHIIAATFQECATALGTRMPDEVLATLDLTRCNHGSGHSLEGYTIWHNPNCENYAGRDAILEGTCDECLVRCNDWRIEHGYEPIARDTESRTYRGIGPTGERHTNRGDHGRFANA